MIKIDLLPGEKIDTIPASDRQIIQSKNVFSFGIDAVLLARFARLPKNGHIVDLCAGSGAVGLLASSLTAAKISLIEIQPQLADMAERSVALNELTEQVQVITNNLKNALQYIPPTSVDLIYCNPPYFKLEEQGRLNDNPRYSEARHELSVKFDDICKIARQLLKSKGHFVFIHRPERFFELTSSLQAAHLIPKRIQFVHPKPQQPANLLLIDAIKDGNLGGEVFLPPLIVHEEEGAYTSQMREIYGLKGD